MNKQSDDFRAYLGSFFDRKDEQEEKVSVNDTVDMPQEIDESNETSSPDKAPETETSSEKDDAELTTEELFRQGAQAAQADRRLRETLARKQRAAEAEAWLHNSVRDETADSSQGFDFLAEEKEIYIPPPDEWPAFEDIDQDNVIIRYGTHNERTKDALDESHSEEREDLLGDGPVRRRSVKSTLILFINRLLGAVVVLALAGVAVYGSTRGHTQSQEVNAPAFQGTPAPAQLACTGVFERSLEVGMSVENVDERITSGALLFATGNASISQTHIRASSSDAVGIAGIPQAIGVFHGENEFTSLAGLNMHRAEAGDMRGLASSVCLGGQVDTYLVGSEISVGTSNELVLVNLSYTATTVQLEALGSAGSLEASSVENIVIDAQSVKKVSLDGAIDGDKRLALHISAPTGAVAAFVQQTALEGAKPAGVSWISPSSSAEHLVIPGLAIPFDSVDFPRVRIANFEDKPAKVSVLLRSEEETLKRADLTDIDIAAHSVLDIPLDGIDGGTYSAIITSDIPVAAGAELVYRQSVDAPRDIAWAGAVSPAHEALGVFGSMLSTLVLSGQETGEATVFLYSRDGTLLEKSKVNISETRSAVVTMPSEAVAVRVSADVPVSGAIIGQASLEDGGTAIDWLPLVSRADDVGKQRISVW